MRGVTLSSRRLPCWGGAEESTTPGSVLLCWLSARVAGGAFRRDRLRSATLGSLGMRVRTAIRKEPCELEGRGMLAAMFVSYPWRFCAFKLVWSSMHTSS